ncbi:hypothetical protein C3L33_14502, partial [Rhododendron williamsianum]
MEVATTVEGIQGIMTAYTSALFNVSLAGPTLFGPVINTAAQIAGQSLADNHQKYFVLLIITDGVITDLQETKDALVKAWRDLSCSISSSRITFPISNLHANETYSSKNLNQITQKGVY